MLLLWCVPFALRRREGHVSLQRFGHVYELNCDSTSHAKDLLDLRDF